jgi:hypothetical protein
LTERGEKEPNQKEKPEEEVDRPSMDTQCPPISRLERKSPPAEKKENDTGNNVSEKIPRSPNRMDHRGEKTLKATEKWRRYAILLIEHAFGHTIE